MVDLTDVVSVTRALVDVDSTTGREGEAVSRLLAFLKDAGFAVIEQPVEGDRRNLYATLGKVDVVLSTHIDCVPPFFPSRLEGDCLFGRGSCDAKGIIAAQIAAVERMRRDGVTTVGLLFVVGEERGSDGARAAQTLASGSKYLINGEPTDNRLGIATRGILRVLLKATGRASHSSYPELGDSAIEKLLDALVALRSLDLPDDKVMGRTHYNIGVIGGGVAPNVVPAQAEAEVMFRTVGDLTELRGAIATLERWVRLEEVLDVPPVTMQSAPGFETASFPYTTDIPFHAPWGMPLLYGPGSIHVAHTDHEHVKIADLHRAVDDYTRLATYLLDEAQRLAGAQA